ncbi:unnamed protein product [Allacma fusca]|uniref:Uncharacterized protein n=1 Tax=Allacma fusca TaxID=39272 RepID=A0A8J2JIJ5_9HEXA|nr:unnamed protein product [Allacma fusca]
MHSQRLASFARSHGTKTLSPWLRHTALAEGYYFMKSDEVTSVYCDGRTEGFSEDRIRNGKECEVEPYPGDNSFEPPGAPKGSDLFSRELPPTMAK